jgi:hypothetical protein
MILINQSWKSLLWIWIGTEQHDNIYLIYIKFVNIFQELRKQHMIKHFIN